MKLFIFIILCLPVSVFSQRINSTDKGDQSNIYNDAIKHYLRYTSKENVLKGDTIYIEKNETITDGLQTSIDGKLLKILDYATTMEKLKIKNSSLILCRIFPLSYNQDMFSISIIPFHTTKQKCIINLANGGGCKVNYSFDNNTNEFKFIEVRCSGI